MAQSDPRFGIRPTTGIIRTTVMQALREVVDERDTRAWPTPRRIQYPYDPAHVAFSLVATLAKAQLVGQPSPRIKIDDLIRASAAALLQIDDLSRTSSAAAKGIGFEMRNQHQRIEGRSTIVALEVRQ